MNSGKINNFFCKLRNFGSCFFLAFFLNFNSVKASQIPNTSEIQKVIELIKSKDDNQLKKLITIVKSNGKTLVVLEFEELQEEFRKKGFQELTVKVIDSGESDQDPRIIEIYYPNVVTQPTEYVLPRVQIEISCRSLREPFTVQTFGSLVDEFYADRDFPEPLFKVPTVNPERTFLEKVFLLHEEFHRPTDKMRVDRLSRHLYDIYHLTKTGIAANAINDKELYETIVSHRYKFSRVGEVDYNLHHPNTLNPIPPKEVIADWEADYAKMKEDMIYEENKPGFEELINNLDDLRTLLQALDWQFELKFTIPNS